MVIPTFALRVALEQVMSIGEGVDFLLSLDQETVDMHGSEVREGGYIICDSKVNPDSLNLKVQRLIACPSNL